MYIKFELKEFEIKLQNMIEIIQKEVKIKFTSQKNSNDIDLLLQKANQAYIEKDHDSVIHFALECLRLKSDCFDAFNLLSLVFEEKNDPGKCADFMFLRLLIRKSIRHNASEWEEVGDRYVHVKKYASASYCFHRAFKLDKSLVHCLYKKAQCYESLDNEKGMLLFFEKYLRLKNYLDKDVVVKLVQIYHSQGSYY